MKTLIHFQDNNVVVDDDDGEMLNMKICNLKEGWMKIDFGGGRDDAAYNDVGAKKVFSKQKLNEKHITIGDFI